MRLILFSLTIKMNSASQKAIVITDKLPTLGIGQLLRISCDRRS